MSQITGVGFASGAIGAGVNEAIIGEIKKIKDPGTAQIVSAIVGAAAAKAVGGNASAGATAAASGTKWNYLLEWQYRRMQEELSKAVTEEEKSAIRERWAKVDKSQEDRMRKDMANRRVYHTLNRQRGNCSSKRKKFRGTLRRAALHFRWKRVQKSSRYYRRAVERTKRNNG